MHFIENTVRDLYDSNLNFIITAYPQFGNDQRVGRITVTIHLLELLEDEDVFSLILRHSDANGVLRRQKDIRLTLIDFQHRHDAIRKLCKDPSLEYNWTREQLPVFITILVNGKALSGIDMTKHSKLMNTAFKTVLSCNVFLGIPVFITLLVNGQAHFAMDMTKNCKLLNTAYKTVLSYNSFLVICRSVIAYAITFHAP